MACPCTNCEKPPCSGFVLERSFRAGAAGVSSPGYPFLTPAAAKAQANADMGAQGWSAFGAFEPVAQTIVSGVAGDYRAAVSECVWRVRHARTGTCYLRQKVYRTTIPDSGVTEEYDYSWTAADTADCQDIWEPDGSTKYVFSAELGSLSPPTLTPDTGTAEIRLQSGNEFSCLPGYFPGDGEPNGFPI